MDFVVSKSDLIAALEQILQGRKEDSGDVIDLAADKSSLSLVITGRSAEIAAESNTQGRAGVSIHLIFKLRQMLETYKERSIRIQVSKGSLLLQKNSISDPGITMKKIGPRAIDIPEDAMLKDILSLPMIFSRAQIKDSGLQPKVQKAERKFEEDLDGAAKALHEYGFNRHELWRMATLKIKAHADAIKPVLTSQAE